MQKLSIYMKGIVRRRKWGWVLKICSTWIGLIEACCQGMPIIWAKSCPTHLQCVWEPFSDCESIPMKLGGLRCPWIQWISQKGRDSAKVIMAISWMSCCKDSSAEGLDLGEDKLDSGLNIWSSSIKWFNMFPNDGRNEQTLSTIKRKAFQKLQNWSKWLRPCIQRIQIMTLVS